MYSKRACQIHLIMKINKFCLKKFKTTGVWHMIFKYEDGVVGYRCLYTMDYSIARCMFKDLNFRNRLEQKSHYLYWRDMTSENIYFKIWEKLATYI